MTRIGLLEIDLATSSFQVCGVVSNKAMSRPRLHQVLADQPPCMVAMEACATSHHWGRVARSHGHEARLIPAAYLKPFVKRQSEAEEKMIQ